MNRFLKLTSLLALFAVASLAIAFQDDAPPLANPLAITASAVEGKVQYRVDSDSPWQPLTVGTALKPGAEIRTGLKSACRLDIEPAQKLSLDRLSFFKIIVANRVANVVKTDIGMNYGRARYRVKSQGEEHNARVISPSATLAIRGTDSMISSDAFKDTFRSSGAALISNKITKRNSVIGANQTQRAEGDELNGTQFAKNKTTLGNPRGDFTGQSKPEKKRFDKHPGDAGNFLGSQFDADRRRRKDKQNNKVIFKDVETSFP